MPTRPDSREASVGPSQASSSLPGVLAGLFQNPQRILFLWNWKSAWLSVILRGPIFLAATMQRGFLAMLSAVLTECLFCAISAGFYGALAQSVRDATPAWLTAVFLTVIVPAIFQVLEYSLHLVRGTPHLRLAEFVSIFVAAVSSLFNWYAMRRGALLVGGEGGSFGSDLRRLPALLVSFVVGFPRRIARSERTHVARDGDSPDMGSSKSGKGTPQ